ncbi:hypothetical protein ATK36_0477 [Amycolatopsis sulphurea]|uniref:Uncharacterized protein n=1 Tax=Amycolatopsis sulphurea TaxID=76022 RepID=A0A2A9G211_9PSEU|nr:hypothetical protein [Amycolatopsis sulphurea]PFG56941.1 hypothetical protein ATK36_0477 [Amycolatopsis sulphurea]
MHEPNTHTPTGIDVPEVDAQAGARLVREQFVQTRATAVLTLAWTVFAVVVGVGLTVRWTGQWSPPWWIALTLGATLPDAARAVRDLVLLAAHRVVFHVETSGGRIVRGCGQVRCRSGCREEAR